MFEFFWNLVSFVIALGILITVHEYGHFWVARKNGVKVQKFSIGFGKTLWSHIGKDGTEYVIALIPLGGFVKMLDDRVDDILPEDSDKTFNSKTVYQRIAIIAAGPFANFAFAIIAFYLMFLIGVPSIKPMIGNIEPASISAMANLPAQSQIVEVAGKKVTDWQDVNLALVGEIGSSTIEIKTKQEDSVNIITSVLNTKEWQFSPDKISAIDSLGIKPFRPNVYNELAVIHPDSPAAISGLKVGDVLLEVNGISVKDKWYDFSNKIQTLADQSVEILIEREGLNQIITVVPKAISRNGTKIGYLGVTPKSDKYPEKFKINTSYGLLDALEQSINRTWNLVVLSFDMIGKLLIGDVSVKNLSGPISIAQGAGDSANFGLVYFLGFLALISINLGIINLLPLPVLDGGHLLYYIIELFTGKPVPEKIQEVGFKFGTITLLCLMSIALFNDLSRL
ncbi:sigma E protease regulator RseP [Colwellia sp. UCD-KL20]|uniref:sigma E protease regulator RseP n=1 Tax=Colwellia sp. UCD-KL20 TaxID=1917165 RepID=UPI00097120D4|nr:sigma E protease regulator RseP [Colwellia sp. UCD-KL20]